MLKKGDRVLVVATAREWEGDGTVYDATGDVRITFTSKDGKTRSDWVDPARVIPIPPPLDAPDEPGPWLNCVDGVWTARQIVMHNPGGKLGFLDGDYWVTLFNGTWHRIPDIFGAGEVEPEPKTLAETIKATSGRAECEYLLAEAVDKLSKRLDVVMDFVGLVSTPAQPARKT